MYQYYENLQYVTGDGMCRYARLLLAVVKSSRTLCWVVKRDWLPLLGMVDSVANEIPPIMGTSGGTVSVYFPRFFFSTISSYSGNYCRQHHFDFNINSVICGTSKHKAWCKSWKSDTSYETDKITWFGWTVVHTTSIQKISIQCTTCCTLISMKNNWQYLWQSWFNVKYIKGHSFRFTVYRVMVIEVPEL